MKIIIQEAILNLSLNFRVENSEKPKKKFMWKKCIAFFPSDPNVTYLNTINLIIYYCLFLSRNR